MICDECKKNVSQDIYAFRGDRLICEKCMEEIIRLEDEERERQDNSQFGLGA